MTENPAENWLQKYGDKLYRFARMRVRDPQQAEDLVQTTLLDGLKGLDNFQGRSSESTWLVGILKHKILDLYRTQGRMVPVEDEALQAAAGTGQGSGPGMAAGGASWASPEKNLQNQEFMGALRGCLDGLPEKQRIAFALRELDGLETDEICKQIDVSPTHLWVILHRARMKLRGCLGRSWLGSESSAGT